MEAESNMRAKATVTEVSNSIKTQLNKFQFEKNVYFQLKIDILYF